MITHILLYIHTYDYNSYMYICIHAYLYKCIYIHIIMHVIALYKYFQYFISGYKTNELRAPKSPKILRIEPSAGANSSQNGAPNVRV